MRYRITKTVDIKAGAVGALLESAVTAAIEPMVYNNPDCEEISIRIDRTSVRKLRFVLTSHWRVDDDADVSVLTSLAADGCTVEKLSDAGAGPGAT